MSFRLKNTEAFLEGQSDKLKKLARLEISKPRSRSYSSGRTLNTPIATRPNMLSKSLETSSIISKSGSNMKFNVKGNSYGEQVDEGTPPGTNVRVSKIEKWIERKPVNLQDSKGASLRTIANRISQKINREGIKPTHFLRDLLEKQFNAILGVESIIITDINMDLDGFLKSIGYSQAGDTFKLKKL
jgi:hypothetical protein|tara:strand:+ start:981 stop:1538 length:558 start_codon:yes stop_codon:yes gene_type:complete